MISILGLNVFHPDSAACIIQDGQLIAAVAEERLGERIKHISCFPSKAIARVLEMAGLNLGQIDYVAIGHDNNANLGKKFGHLISHPGHAISYLKDNSKRRKDTRSLKAHIAEACNESESICRFQIIPVEHHLAHLASAFYCSPYDEAAGFSYDASGDFVSTMYAHCKGTQIDVIKRIYLPDSLGIFYSSICQYLGFNRFGEEYKVMGLSAYGQNSFAPLMKTILTTDKMGGFKLSPKYFNPMSRIPFKQDSDIEDGLKTHQMYTNRWISELGPARRREEPITQREKDLAQSCQVRFEEVVLECLNWLAVKVPSSALITAGGCALNGLCNSRILRETPFKKSYIQCAASDDGTALGAAYYVWHQILGMPRQSSLNQAYLGPEYPEDAQEAALKLRGLSYEQLSEETLVEKAANLLNDGKIIGWYQGRSEWGPRALGNRSILAHPGWPGMKDTINRRIKRREGFRPFAPSILAESVPEYFEQDVSSPFMMHVARIREEKRKSLASVTHEDFTGRMHTVSRSQNPRYYSLIEEFSRLSGIPVLLNTSFNENEPVVDTPLQAVDCFIRNDIDALCLGNFLILKTENLFASKKGEIPTA